jgi:type IX secretion system substrate protein
MFEVVTVPLLATISCCNLTFFIFFQSKYGGFIVENNILSLPFAKTNYLLMKHFILLLLVSIVTASHVSAQCPTCTPAFITCPPAGGLCNKLDTAYANHPYNKVINFYMPKVITDPTILSQCGGCSSVDLLSITVTGVSGLPTGITYLISNNSYFDVQNGDSLGCATFCGTPLLAGVYVVTVYLSADVTAIGTPIGNVTQDNNPQKYIDTLWVLPDTTAGVSSFTYGNNGSSACDSITISLNALYSAPQPNMTRYFWTLPNGQTSQAQSPGTFKFTNNSSVPDTIPITLTTIFYNYVVSYIHVAQIFGGFCGTIPHQQLTCICVSGADSPNPFVEFPLLGFDNSANAPTATCRNINFTPNNSDTIPAGTFTLPMQLWDLDEGDPFHIYINELISTYNLNVVLGQQNFSDNNAEGYVQFDTVEGTVITETLNVIVNPTPRTPNVTSSKDTFCSGDSVLIAVDTAAYYNGCTYTWYQDTVLLLTQTDSAFYTTQPGKYKVIITNSATGCSNTSAFKTVSEGQSPSSSAYIVFTGSQEFINPLPAGFAANWYYNGNLVTGHNGDILPFLGNGAYQAEVYNVAYPGCSRMLSVDSITNTGINMVSNKVVYNLNILPNPNNGTFSLQFSSPQAQRLDINMRNVIGEVVYSKTLEGFVGNFNEEVNLANLSKGIYIITVESAYGTENRKVVIQ